MNTKASRDTHERHPAWQASRSRSSSVARKDTSSLAPSSPTLVLQSSKSKRMMIHISRWRRFFVYAIYDVFHHSFVFVQAGSMFRTLRRCKAWSPVHPSLTYTSRKLHEKHRGIWRRNSWRKANAIVQHMPRAVGVAHGFPGRIECSLLQVLLGLGALGRLGGLCRQCRR